MKISHYIAIITLSCLSFPAFAYIDPGSGSAVMSAIIGFIVACWLVIKTYWYKIKSFFVSTSKPTEAEATARPGSDPTDKPE